MITYSITTTLPYVNADPHIGFALEIVQADMLARYHRGLGEMVVFNTGTDEHGQKIYQKALEAGIDVKSYCDQYAARFDGLKVALNLSYTNFIRTTDEHHIVAAQEFWKRCDANGDIYKKQYSVKYCVGCELEKTDSELVDGRCPDHANRELETIEEENYFFAFSKYQAKLLELYRDRPDFVLPKERMNEIRTFVEGGLHDFSISRLKSKMPWGVPVPGDDGQVMYVWFDALVNYISTLGWPSFAKASDGRPTTESDFDEVWPSVQVAGKDNLRQQTAMWQAMLMSAKIVPSKQVFIHGYITANGQKMSKSIGNVINPYDLVEEFGTDAVRLYLLAALTSWQDGDYSKEQFEILFATKLANGIGNLMSRVAAMAAKSFPEGLDRIDWPQAMSKNEALANAITNYDFKRYCDIVWGVVDVANDKIEKEAPFRLVKTDREGAKKSLSELVGMIRWIAKALVPVIPATADKIQKHFESDIITASEPLFPRREIKFV